MTERIMHNWLHDSVSFMSICTFSLSVVEWMVVVPLFDFNVPFFIFSVAGKTGLPDCAKMSVIFSAIASHFPRVLTIVS